jgi:hypothetical protein
MLLENQLKLLTYIIFEALLTLEVTKHISSEKLLLDIFVQHLKKHSIRLRSY